MSILSGGISNNGAIASSRRGIGLGFAPNASRYRRSRPSSAAFSIRARSAPAPRALPSLPQSLPAASPTAARLSARGMALGSRGVTGHCGTPHIANVGSFAGGIINSGAISAGRTPLWIRGRLEAFTGGISNSGTALAGGHGIAVASVRSFSGGISQRPWRRHQRRDDRHRGIAAFPFFPAGSPTTERSHQAAAGSGLGLLQR